MERQSQAAYVLQGFARGIITRNALQPVIAARELRRSEARLANTILSVTKLQCFFRVVAARRQKKAMQALRDAKRRERKQAMISRLIVRVAQGYRARLVLNAIRNEALRKEPAAHRNDAATSPNHPSTATDLPLPTAVPQPTQPAVPVVEAPKPPPSPPVVRNVSAVSCNIFCCRPTPSIVDPNR